jgi:hypothetical protein
VPNNNDLPVRQRPLSDLDFGGEGTRGASTPLLDDADRFLATSTVPAAPNILVHGDCWQGNTMWNRDTFSGFVDGDAAGIGQPGLDLGPIRFDPALCYGIDELDLITHGWVHAGGPPIDNLAYWDITAALSSPTDLTPWMPVITAAGRNDLDINAITERRHHFVTATLRCAIAPFLDHVGRDLRNAVSVDNAHPR